ncbi:endo alpha-1,4 polygalactosaminidase [Streptomyces albus]|uniref:endo alpha-1,4 polygalactosaminidase n=1 Tax=Streptomyces albus TaxID=1888 RepID=UPI0033F9A8D9
MHRDRRRPYRALGAALAATGLLLAAAQTSSAAAPAGTAPVVENHAVQDVTLPPAHADFDYQIGGAYTPPKGVKAVSRDHTAKPADGLYNICYVNAFQAQRGAEGQWDEDLLLRDANGKIVYDGDWHEALLDIRTKEKRERIAAKVGGWIDDCAAKGFQAVEPDNYDSYTRSKKLLTASQAQSFIRLLSARAHENGLAIGQKNTSELAESAAANGLDFAVAEQCGQYDECDEYTEAFGDEVIVIEYTDEGFANACEKWGDQLSVVRRDEDVSTPDKAEYVRETC